MDTRTIGNLKTFHELESAWESVRSRDPHATFFSSWAWLRGWMSATRDHWRVLAVTTPGHAAPVAFLPLGIRSKPSPFQLRDESEIYVAGAPMSDRTGLLCLPGHQDRAIPALARAAGELMRRLGALRFEMEEVADPRWPDFLQCFDPDGYIVRWDRRSPCPCIPLPASWDAYMEGSKKRRALLRRAEREGFVITHADDETIERDVELFLRLHQARLGPKPPRYLQMMRSLVHGAHRAGSLHLAVLWLGDAPTAVNVGFLDRPRRTFHAYNGGWDEWYRKFSPRRIAELHSIRWAIGEGARIYDLGRGDERYKFGFGAVERFNANALLERRTALTSARELVRRIPELLPVGDERSAAPRASLRRREPGGA